jgi:hypothetical protein
MEHRTTQIGKSPAMPPPIWKNPIFASLDSRVYQSASIVMYSMPVFTVWTFSTSPVMTCPANIFPIVESSQPGTTIGRFFSIAACIHESFSSIW